MTHNFKPGSFVKFKDRATATIFGAKPDATAVVVATKNDNPGKISARFPFTGDNYFHIKWLDKDNNTCVDGLWDTGNFVDVDTATCMSDMAPFNIGDIVRIKNKDRLFVVVYTDWHRGDASGKFTENMESIIDDEDDVQTYYLNKNPQYVYVVSVDAPTGLESCGGYLAETFTLVKTRQDIKYFCER